MMIIPLAPSLLTGSSSLPGDLGRAVRNISLFGLAPCGVLPAIRVATNAVRSYRTFSPLLAGGGRFVLCGTFPGVAPAGCYPAPHVDGARTFLSRSLSAGAGAAVRPTDAPVMGLEAEEIKPAQAC